MDEAQLVLARLDRIESLQEREAPPAVLLGELRALLHEAEAWAASEGDVTDRRAADRAGRAIERVREALEPAEATVAA